MAGTAVLSRGRITIPVHIRKKLGIKTGDHIRFVERKSGEIILKRDRRSIMELAGIIKWKGKPVSVEEMNQITRDGWAGLLKLDDS